MKNRAYQQQVNPRWMMERFASDVNNESYIGCVLPHTITDDQWKVYDSLEWWLEGVGTVIIGVLGVFLNIITIFVLLNGELASSFFNWLLTSLALFDSLFLLSGISEAFRNHLVGGVSYYHDLLFVTFLYPFRNIMMCCSIYTTVILALERYNALENPVLCQPYLPPSVRLSRRKKTLRVYFSSHCKRLVKYIGPIVVFSTGFYIPKWMEVGIETRELCIEKNHIDNTNYTVCEDDHQVVVNNLRNNTYYNLWYLNVANLLITAVIPLLSIIYLNVNIYYKFIRFLKRQPQSRQINSSPTDHPIQPRQSISRQKQEKDDFVQQMWILFSIVILFVLCHILRIVLNIEEFLYLDVRKLAKENRNCEWLQYWTITASVVSHLLLQINSSINIAIYCYFNHSFRKELWGLFRRIIKCSSETITSSNETTNKHYIPSTDNKEIENIDEILPAEPDGKDSKSNAEQIELNIINGGIETAV